MTQKWTDIIEDTVHFRTDEHTPPEEIERIRAEVTARIQEKIDRCRKKSFDEWFNEAIEMSQWPLPTTPKRQARAEEMKMRAAQIDQFLEGNGPEPEWPWTMRNPVSEEERKQELEERAESFLRVVEADERLWDGFKIVKKGASDGA